MIWYGKLIHRLSWYHVILWYDTIHLNIFLYSSPIWFDMWFLTGYEMTGDLPMMLFSYETKTLYHTSIYIVYIYIWLYDILYTNLICYDLMFHYIIYICNIYRWRKHLRISCVVLFAAKLASQAQSMLLLIKHQHFPGTVASRFFLR